jgi:hypothetical protein
VYYVCITSVTIQSGRARLVMANIPAAVNRVPEIIDNLSIFRITTITLHHISKIGSCFEAKANLGSRKCVSFWITKGAWEFFYRRLCSLSSADSITTKIFVRLLQHGGTVIRKKIYFLFIFNLAVNAEIWRCIKKSTLNLLQ